MLLKNLNFATLRRYFSAKNTKSILKIFEDNKIGDNVEIKGWVKSLRKQKENVFIDISDGSTDKKLQIFIPNNMMPADLSTGTSIVTQGTLSMTPKGQMEVTASHIDIFGKCIVTEGYPFAPRKQYTPEYIRQHLQFRPRTNIFASLLRVRNSASLALHNFFNTEGYINIHTPILTSNDCEGAGEVFTVVPDNSDLLKSMAKKDKSPAETYFDTKVYLSVSGQLHLEAAVHGLSKVYSFGPTFRAENARSRLHLSEFYMLEAEMAFVNKLENVMEIVEKLIKNVTKTVLDRSLADVERCLGENCSIPWLEKSFPILTYDEAAKILDENKSKLKEDFNKNDGFGKEHEIFLANHCGGGPTFVINWPKSMKPFYMRKLDADTTKVAAFDLLAPVVGEIVGGSLRENDYDKLKEKLPLGNNQLDWYLDLRKFGGVPTGGFGLGFERYLQLILGINNIKDTIPFPRWPHNCSL